MGKPTVSIVNYEAPFESVKKAVELCRGLDHMPAGATVFIKPNIVFWTKAVAFPKWGVVTTSRVVEDIVALLKDHGAGKILIGEGTVTRMPKDVETPRHAFETLGYPVLAKRYGVAFVNVFERPFETVDLGEGIKLNFNTDILHSDFVVDLPVLKTHNQTVVSLGIKNLKGTIDIASRKKCHSADPHKDLHFWVSHLAEKMPPMLTVIDGIFSAERGPGFDGRLHRRNVLIASTDVLAADLVGAKVLGYDGAQVPHLAHAAVRHGRSADLADIEVVGKTVAEVAVFHDHQFDYSEYEKDAFLPTPLVKEGLRGISYRSSGPPGHRQGPACRRDYGRPGPFRENRGTAGFFHGPLCRQARIRRGFFHRRRCALGLTTGLSQAKDRRTAVRDIPSQSIRWGEQMAKVQSSGISDVGRKRKGNEDSFFIDEGLQLYVVADGMGGHNAGEVASRIVVDTIKELMTRFKADPQAGPLTCDPSLSPDACQLVSAIHTANGKVFEAARSNPAYKGMGSTVSAVYVVGEKLITANVGDSPIYLIRNAAVEPVYVPHTMMAEYEALAPGGSKALAEKFRHMITRAMGIAETVKPDVFETLWKPGDQLVISSDGLTDKVAPEEILALAGLHQTESLCRRLVDMANQRGGDDNITVITLAIAADTAGRGPVPVQRGPVAVHIDTEEASYSGLLKRVEKEVLFIETVEPFAQDSPLMLTIPDPEGHEALMLTATVARRRTTGIDVTFEGITADQQAILDKIKAQLIA